VAAREAHGRLLGRLIWGTLGLQLFVLIKADSEILAEGHLKREKIE
jgi:hypothetical protein